MQALGMLPKLTFRFINSTVTLPNSASFIIVLPPHMSVAGDMTAEVPVLVALGGMALIANASNTTKFWLKYSTNHTIDIAEGNSMTIAYPL